MSKFFIERPILANVIAIITILLGAVCLYNLPVAQYPQIVPPTIQVSTSYALQRRNNWPQVAANCPAFDVKQRILSHEYEELVEDEHSKKGHLDLIFRQGKEVGLSVDEITNAEPLPTTRAAMYAWFWIAQTRPWQEAIAPSTIAEWTNDDRLLGDIGGGNCSRLYEIWTRDLNFTAAQVPNFTAHSKADVKHSDMFLDVLERYVAPGREQDVLTTAKESMDIHRAYFGGMAQAMERTS